MKKQAILLCLGLLMSLYSFAQSEFTVSVSYDTVGLSESFKVKYTLKNTKLIGTFTPPPFDDFTLIAGPMQSQSISIINGNMSQSYTYTYILQAQDLGDFVLAGTSIETEEGHLLSDDISIVVVKEVSRPAPSNNLGQNPFNTAPFFNGGGFGFEQHNEMQQRMLDMQKQMEQRMKDFWGPTPQEPPVNKSPKEAPSTGKKPSEDKKKKKNKGKVYKI